MKIPPGVKSYKLSRSTVWLDEDGVVCNKSNDSDNLVPTRQELEEDIARLHEIAGQRKVCVITEPSNQSRPPIKADRDFITQELKQFTIAMAIITTSPLTRMVANLFFGFKPPSYPTKMFSNYREAKSWISKYSGKENIPIGKNANYGK